MSEIPGSLVTRVYTGFTGVDFRGEETALSRSPDSLNVWRDYKEQECIKTRPKMKKIATTSSSPQGAVYGIFYSKNKNFRFKINNSLCIGGRTENEIFRIVDYLDDVGEKQCIFKHFDDYELILTEKTYSWSCNSIGGTVGGGGFIPTTTIGRRPAGGGTFYQDVNLISPYRKNAFEADGESTEFYLDTQSIDEIKNITINSQDIISIRDENGYVVYSYEVDCEAGKITITPAPPAPLTSGQDNVIITFKKENTADYDKINNCKIMEIFDNRVFFAGNPDYPNMFWYSALDDPTYIQDRDFEKDGSSSSTIKAMVPGNDALWVFKEPSAENTNIFYHKPLTDAEHGKIYPNSSSNIAVGCKGKAINFNDDIVFFSDRGMEGISGDITTEQAVVHRSTLVDEKLLKEPGYEDMILVEWEGYLMCIMGKKAYLADSRSKFTNIDHYEYEWFYWEFDREILCAANIEGELLLGCEDGIYSLSDEESPLISYWTTPKDRFKYPHYQKTTNKRGCVTEATGDISLFVKTDKSDFELIGKYENINDKFVSRIKRKKFKDIQLKFYSDTRMRLEGTTIECFIGGYIKR